MQSVLPFLWKSLFYKEYPARHSPFFTKLLPSVTYSSSGALRGWSVKSGQLESTSSRLQRNHNVADLARQVVTSLLLGKCVGFHITSPDI